jgi:hypothetical protein
MTRLDWKGTASLAAALLLAGCAQSPQPAGQMASDEAILPANMNPDGLPAPTENLVFPWSVVPGGVRSPEGAQQAVDRDPIVKEHYRAVDIAKLRTEKLSKSKSAYVSYRMGDSIYWTRNPVLIKAGETVLSDGETMLRGRCGNMVSETARLPVAPAHLEPPAAAMDVAVPASRLVAAIPPAISGERLEPSQAALDRAPHVSTSVLPSPEPQDALPGYAPHGASGGGFVPVTGSGGGGAPASLGPPPESTSPPPIPVVITPMTPPTLPPTPPLYQPPPNWPTNWYPPPPDQPLPPPPVLYPPPEHPPLPPPPYHPPGQPPPGGPPPHNPPPGGPPPGSPPPSGPPPGGPPPPSGPPPSDPPPHLPPPPFDPPNDPPPPEPPPAVPEPTAFVLIGLGMIGLGIHLSRYKG